MTGANFGTGEVNRIRELRLRLTSSGAGEQGYKLHVESPAGESESSFRLPFSQAQAEEALASIPNVIDEFQRSSPRTVPSDTIRKIGEILFTSLFSGRVGSLYQQALEMAKAAGESLCLRLILDDPRVAALPWEFLYDPGRNDFIALSTYSPLVRQFTSPNFSRLETIEPPLKIMAVTAETVLGMEAEQEVEILERLCTKDERLQLSVLRQATPKKLYQALSEQSCHILHIVANGIIAYSNTSGADGRSSLALLSEQSNKEKWQEEWRPGEFVDASHLASMLYRQADLHLICLSGDLTHDLAAELARNWSAVIGWRGNNTTRAYLSFTEGLYATLLVGQPLPLAVTQGRQQIDLNHPGGKEWGMPVCYLQAAESTFIPSTPKKTTPRSERGTPSNRAAGIGLNQPENNASLRRWRKLQSLLEIEQHNLQSLKEEMARHGEHAPDILEEQHRETLEKIGQLEAELQKLTD